MVQTKSESSQLRAPDNLVYNPNEEMQDFTPLQGLRRNKISGVSFSTSRESFPYDESCTLKVKFGVDGGIRDSFRHEIWMDAHKRNDKYIRITYKLEIKKVYAGLALKSLIKPVKAVKKASIYWTRNPEMVNLFEKKVWALIIDERRTPHIPATEEEARKKLFEFEASFQILGVDVGVGKHTLRAQVGASWGKHIFSEKGTVSGNSSSIKITCT